jgi:hypothetical protein
MSTAGWIVLAVAVVLAVLAVVALMGTKRRERTTTDHLRERFGPEYERLAGGRERAERREAEAELARREMRREHLDIRPLPVESRNKYLDTWRDIQSSFVDEPEQSVVKAEDLVVRVMSDRGYPVANEFENQAELISVDHPQLVQNYRQAHSTFERAQQHSADTEELRSSLVYYRSLFNELLAA